MPPLKKISRDQRNDTWNDRYNLPMRVLSFFVMIAGPILLVYINVRCEKNQCVLLQFPLVLPTHFGAFFSLFSAVVVFAYLLITFFVSSVSKLELDRKKGKSKANFAVLPSSFICLLTLSTLIMCIAYLKPEYIKFVRSEYLRILCSTIVFCFVFSLVLAVMIKFNFLHRERDYSFALGYFHGFNTRVKIGLVDLKYYFYVHAGLVAWALVDLLIFISFVLDHPVTAPLYFVFITQYILIVHTLYFERFLIDRPFVNTEGLGFFWLMRVLLFTPFLFSLPVLYTAATEITIPKAAMVANCALFMFGFMIYVSSLHQKESCTICVTPPRTMKFILAQGGKRLLVGGYWGKVQKPDYLGFLIMWLSWAVACGLSAVSVIVLSVVYGTVFFWLYQTASYHKEQYGSAWSRYCSVVPHKIIPLVY